MRAETAPRKKTGKVLITAGPTVEYLDPVRYISNRSTGVMGYSIAREFLSAGYEVCLITGPVGIRTPMGAEVVNVTTAREMLRELKKRIRDARCIVMAAAVCDFRPEAVSKEKIKKDRVAAIKVVKNPDILKELGRSRGLVKVGFALETGLNEENAVKKLKNKSLDLVVLNSAGKGNLPFGETVTDYILIGKNGDRQEVRGAGKRKIAGIIFRKTAGLLGEKRYDAG